MVAYGEFNLTGLPRTVIHYAESPNFPTIENRVESSLHISGYTLVTILHHKAALDCRFQGAIGKWRSHLAQFVNLSEYLSHSPA